MYLVTRNQASDGWCWFLLLIKTGDLLLCIGFTSIWRTKFLLHNHSMHPCNRIIPRRKFLRSAFVNWLGHCRFGIFHRDQQFLVFLHIVPERDGREKLMSNVMYKSDITSKWDLLSTNENVYKYQFGETGDLVVTLSASCGLTISSWAFTLGIKAAFKKLTNDAIFQLPFQLNVLKNTNIYQICMYFSINFFCMN